MKFSSRKLPFFLFVLAVAMLTVGVTGLSAQESQPEPRFTVETAAVLLDVVVRDRRGRPIPDLTASDFEVYEDGVRQQIESFRLVVHEGGTTSSPAAEPPPGSDTPSRSPVTPLEELNFIAMVFDRLSPDARARAHETALQYLDEQLVRPSDMVGVFKIDLSLQVLQNYTNDAALLRQAIERLGSTTSANFISGAAEARGLSSIEEALERSAAATASEAAAAGGPGTAAQAQAAGSATGEAVAEQLLGEMNRRLLENFESLQRDQQGYATTNGLISVVGSLGALSGRKTILFFSEGLSIPPNVQARFRSVIHAANRANVSVYTLDAAGLRIESTGSEAARELAALANRRINQAYSGRDDTSGPLMRALERNEDLLRLDPHSGLGQLAQETGGFLISETNNLVTGLRQIDQDMRAYYLLAYVPRNQEDDGRFREIDVKVNRPGASVQTRKGYYAVDSISTHPLLDYEAPALALARKTEAPGSLAVLALGLDFPGFEETGRVGLLVEVPPGVFTYEIVKAENTYRADFSIVALIRDRAKQVVRKTSQQYLLGGEIGQLEQARNGRVLFFRETQLAAGEYELEAIAYDGLARRVGIHKSKFEVLSPAGSGPLLSSIVIIRSAEQVGKEAESQAGILRLGELLIYPNLGEPLARSTLEQMPFFFNAYPARGGKAPPEAVFEVVKEGTVTGRSAVRLPAPDQAGRIQFASALPIQGYAPGRYQLRVTVVDKGVRTTRSANFTVQ